MHQTDKENYIPIFQNLAKKILTVDVFTEEEKKDLLVLLNNQIQIQRGSVLVNVMEDDIPYYDFEYKIEK